MIIIVIIFISAVLLGYSNGMKLVLFPKVSQASGHCFYEFSLNHTQHALITNRIRGRNEATLGKCT